MCGKLGKSRMMNTLKLAAASCNYTAGCVFFVKLASQAVVLVSASSCPHSARRYSSTLLFSQVVHYHRGCKYVQCTAS